MHDQEQIAALHRIGVRRVASLTKLALERMPAWERRVLSGEDPFTSRLLRVSVLSHAVVPRRENPKPGRKPEPESTPQLRLLPSETPVPQANAAEIPRKAATMVEDCVIDGY